MRATTIFAVPIILALWGAAAAAPLAAQDPAEDAGLERELRRLDVTLGRLVQLLERQLESSNAAVLMQRVQLMTNRMAPMEQELRAARSEVGGLEDALAEIDLAAASFAAQLDRDLAEGNITDEQARDLLTREEPLSRRRKEHIEARLWAARQRMIDLEQGLDARRAELETWEGEIDRVLGLR